MYPGLLQPLDILGQAWAVISMDFIEGLPKSEGKNVILVVVDKLTKFAHFLSLSHPFNAQEVAIVFMDSVIKLHGVPHSIYGFLLVIFGMTFQKFENWFAYVHSLSS